MVRAVSAVPIIVVTARGAEDEIVRLLDAGADDYVVKPFGGAQLDARIRAVLRRAEPEETTAPVVVGGLSVDARTRQASLDGAPLDLTPREFDLLHYLASRAGTVVSKRELLADVWKLPYAGADKTVDVHLSWLRRKLGETAQEPRYLHTVRRVGVRLAEPGAGREEAARGAGRRRDEPGARRVPGAAGDPAELGHRRPCGHRRHGEGAVADVPGRDGRGGGAAPGGRPAQHDRGPPGDACSCRTAPCSAPRRPRTPGSRWPRRRAAA